VLLTLAVTLSYVPGMSLCNPEVRALKCRTGNAELHFSMQSVTVLVEHGYLLYKYFHHLKGRGYNRQSSLCPRPLRWWKYFAVLYVSLCYGPYTFL